MRKLIAAGLAALTMASALAPAAGAAAQDHRRDYDRDRGYRHDSSGAALAAGLTGLAVGAAIANGGRGDYRDGYYYGPPRYAYEHYYGPRYYAYGYRRHCRTTEVWDPYVGGWVERTRCW